jgi:hypothetical protein
MTPALTVIDLMNAYEDEDCIRLRKAITALAAPRADGGIALKQATDALDRLRGRTRLDDTLRIAVLEFVAALHVEDHSAKSYNAAVTARKKSKRQLVETEWQELTKSGKPERARAAIIARKLKLDPQSVRKIVRPLRKFS